MNFTTTRHTVTKHRANDDGRAQRVDRHRRTFRWCTNTRSKRGSRDAGAGVHEHAGIGASGHGHQVHMHCITTVPNSVWNVRNMHGFITTSRYTISVITVTMLCTSAVYTSQHCRAILASNSNPIIMRPAVRIISDARGVGDHRLHTPRGPLAHRCLCASRALSRLGGAGVRVDVEAVRRDPAIISLGESGVQMPAHVEAPRHVRTLGHTHPGASLGRGIITKGAR